MHPDAVEVLRKRELRHIAEHGPGDLTVESCPCCPAVEVPPKLSGLAFTLCLVVIAAQVDLMPGWLAGACVGSMLTLTGRLLSDYADALRQRRMRSE